MSGDIHQLPQPEPPPFRPHTGGGNGNGHNLHSRVSALEAHLQHLATKEDIQRVETLIAQREASMQRWLIGIVIAAGTSVTIGLIGLALGLIRILLL